MFFVKQTATAVVVTFLGGELSSPKKLVFDQADPKKRQPLADQLRRCRWRLTPLTLVGSDQGYRVVHEATEFAQRITAPSFIPSR
ncbi:MAG TPA: hypothetical protein VLF41_01870 [Candidatus Nanoarchaeia archaeon]|nr:hypothetical protein [Candidatus Nanoarchaeia archaeon]